MEPVGVSASETPKQSEKSETGKSKVWFFVLCGLFVVIVGLVIAIVVVKNLPKGSEEVASEEIVDTAETIYYQANSEIWRKILNNNLETEDVNILALYEEKMNETVDEEAKLLLMMDYYGIVMSQDINNERREEIETIMLDADEKLKTPLSAANIISMAITYGDSELREKYNNILNERIATMDNYNESNGNNIK